MTPEQRTKALTLLLEHLINAAKAGMEAALQFPGDAREFVEADYDEVAAALVPMLLPEIDALLKKLQALGVTP